MKLSWLFCAASACALLPLSVQAQSPVDEVNPMIGTASTKATPAEMARLTDLDPNFPGFHGKMFPGATTPEGMVQLSPDTIIGGDNGAGYSYPNMTIQGFSFQHMSGVGAGGDLGNFLVTATTGPLKTWFGTTDVPGSGYLSSYSKSTEVAHPGYYAVTLDDYKIRAEATAAPHSGILRFTFPANPQSRIQIDLAHRVGGTSLHQTVQLINPTTIEGRIDCTGQGGGFLGGRVNYTLYYHAEFSRPLKTYGVWSATLPPGKINWTPTPAFAAACEAAAVMPGRKQMEGQHLGFYAEFPTTANEQILLKAGISYVSIADARQNLAAEIPGFDFDQAHHQATASWAQALGKIAVTGGTPDQRTIFYTTFYHSMVDPRTQTDVNGNYPGGDGQVHQAVGFTKRTIFSGWDVYRSLFPLLTITQPDIINDQINSAITLADENKTGYYDRWELMNSYTGCMSGSPEVIVMNDAYQKGIRHFDMTKGYQFAADTCTKYGDGPKGYSTGGHGLGYTMQNSLAAWNLSRLAASLGHTDDAAKWAVQGEDYKNVFNPDVPWTYRKTDSTPHPDWKGWIDLRNADGSWAPWGGLTSGNGGMESSVFEEGWAFPQDVPAMMNLMGGQDMFVAKLTDFFQRTPKFNTGNPYDDATNEPSNLIPFLFNRAGAPWETQYYVRRIAREAYSAKVNGACGDDDEGQMSAWYVLAASGLAQACPGDPRYEIMTPLFDKVTFKLDPKYTKGSTFTIVANNNTPANDYIQSATLNGKPLNRCWLNYPEIAAGGTLELTLGPQPNKQWGLATN